MNKYLNHFNYIYDTHYNKEDTYLALQNKKIEDSGLRLICKIQFNKIKYLDLKNNNIKDITALSESKNNFSDLKCLYLDKNKIININPFLYTNMPHLERLNL